MKYHIVVRQAFEGYNKLFIFDENGHNAIEPISIKGLGELTIDFKDMYISVSHQLYVGVHDAARNTIEGKGGDYVFAEFGESVFVLNDEDVERRVKKDRRNPS